MSSLRVYINKVWATVPWREVFAWLPVAGILMLISSLPYGWSVYQKISFFVVGISTGLYYISNEQWKHLTWNKSKWVFVCMLLLFAILPIRQLFDPTPMTGYAWHQLHLNEWFIYVGIIGLIGFTPKLKVQHVACVMLATCVVMLVHSAYLYYGTVEFWFMYPLERWCRLRSTHIHSHMVMNLYANTAIVMGFMALKETKTLWGKVLIGVGMLLSWVSIIFSYGRVGSVTSIIVIGVCVFASLYQKHRNWAIGLSIAALVFGGWVVMNNPRIFKHAIDSDPRKAIWEYSWKMLKEKPICGYGLSTLSEEYVAGVYEDEGMKRDFLPIIEYENTFIPQGKTMLTHHPHNAFLMYWLSYGIIGVLLLLLFFAVAFSMPVGDKRVYWWLILTAIILQCMTEPIGDHLRPQFMALIILVIHSIYCPKESQ